MTSYVASVNKGVQCAYEFNSLRMFAGYRTLQKIEINRFDLPHRIRGLNYEEGNYRAITINTSVKTTNEEVDVMAEEIGHSVIGGGDLFFPEGVDPVVKQKGTV